MAYRLPRLRDNVPIVSTKTGNPLFIFIRWIQSLVVAIETALNTLQDAIDAIALAQTAADDANAAAAAADAAAASAQSATDALTTESNLVNSYVTGCTVTAADAGANTTITISGHTRVYGDGTSVSVTGGTVTGLAYSTGYSVYYVQASRAGGAVTYLATTTPATAAQTGDTHLVGGITTPAAAAPSTTGGAVLPSRIVDIDFYI